MQVHITKQFYERLTNPRIVERNNDLYFTHHVYRDRYYRMNETTFMVTDILFFYTDEYGRVEFTYGDKGFDSYDDMDAIREVIRTRV